MKITGWKKMENCIGGEFVFICFFDAEWTKERIQALAALGALKYYGSFPRPMFQLKCPDGTIVKGVQSAHQCRVIFPRDEPIGARESFEILMRTVEE
jgi:hypothetical protein